MCFECDALLGGKRYLMRDSRPYCCACFESLYSENCEECGGRIRVDEGQMTHLGRHWHATEHCFVCSTCRRSLLGQPLAPHHSRLYCSASCRASSPQGIHQDLKKSFDFLEQLDEEEVASVHGVSEQRGLTWGGTRHLTTHFDVSTDGSQTVDSSGSSAYANIDDVLLSKLSLSCYSSADRQKHSMSSDSVSYQNRLESTDSPRNDAKLSSIATVQSGCDHLWSNIQNVKSAHSPSPLRVSHKICATDYMLYPEDYQLKQCDRPYPSDNVVLENKCGQVSRDARKLHGCSASNNSHSPKISSKSSSAVHDISPAYSYGHIVANGNIVGVAEIRNRPSVMNSVETGFEKLRHNSKETQWQQQQQEQENVYEEMIGSSCPYSDSSMSKTHSQTSSLPDLMADGVHLRQELNSEQISRKMSDVMYLPGPGFESKNSTDLCLNQVAKHRLSSCQSDGALKVKAEGSKEKTEIEKEAICVNPNLENHGGHKMIIHSSTKQNLGLLPPVCSMPPPPPLPPHRQPGCHQALVAGKQMTAEQVMAQYSTVQSEWERCSTCSSSSDSDFDYYLERQPLGLQRNQMSRSEGFEMGECSLQSLTPTRHRNRRKKHSNKHCIIS